MVWLLVRQVLHLAIGCLRLVVHLGLLVVIEDLLELLLLIQFWLQVMALICTA